MMNRAGLRFLAVALWGWAVLATAFSGCGDGAPLLETHVLDWSGDGDQRMQDLKGHYAEIMTHQVALLSGLMEGVRTLGLSAGASAPEFLVEELVSACRARRQVTVEEVRIAEETVAFRSPPIPLARKAS